jgi:hypothetical protein
MAEFVGNVIQHHREDVVFRDSPQRHVLFLYSGVVSFNFGGGDSNIRTEQLQFDVPDSALTPEQIQAPNGIAVILAPTNFNSNGNAFVLAVSNAVVRIPTQGAGLKVFADVSAANATLFEVAYSFAVNTVL